MRVHTFEIKEKFILKSREQYCTLRNKPNYEQRTEIRTHCVLTSAVDFVRGIRNGPGGPRQCVGKAGRAFTSRIGTQGLTSTSLIATSLNASTALLPYSRFEVSVSCVDFSDLSCESLALPCVCARAFITAVRIQICSRGVRGLFLWESSLTVAFQACGVLRPSRMHQRLSGVDPTLGRFPRRSLLLFRSRGRASTTSGFCQVASARPGDPGGGPGAVRPTVKVTVTSLAHGHKVFDFFAISSL